MSRTARGPIRVNINPPAYKQTPDTRDGMTYNKSTVDDENNVVHCMFDSIISQALTR